MRRLVSLAACALAVGAGVASMASASSKPPVVTVHDASSLRVYDVPGSSMEPTLRCAKPAPGCTARQSDVVLVAPLHGAPRRGDILVFHTPPEAAIRCGAGGIFVKRLIGLPGERVREDGQGFIYIRRAGSTTWTKLGEPYVTRAAQKTNTAHFNHTWTVSDGTYFMLGDNRAESCDSRQWGAVPRAKLIGNVVAILRRP